LDNAQEIIEALSSESVQRYILAHEQDDVGAFVLKYKELDGIPASVMADQIRGRKKAKEKLPDYYDAPGIVYPPAVNLEQSSSQATALYKSAIIRNLFPSGQVTGADLTGGFGVDSLYISKVVKRMDYVEREQSLLSFAKHNHEVLGARNIHYHLSFADTFLSELHHPVDFFYADPGRRSAEGKKVHALSDSEPDITSLQHKIATTGKFLLLKTSPLLDIQAALSELLNPCRVFVVSVDNECKEVLYLCGESPIVEPIIETVNLSGTKTSQTFRFIFSQEQEATVIFSDPLKYIYEPNASILKAGAFKTIAVSFGLKKVQKNTHLYTSRMLRQDFPGRIFEVEGTIKGDRHEIEKYFPDCKANITTRNYPLSPEQLKKKTGLTDGGELFLLGFSGQRKKFLAVARRVRP
jgi:hypothetical protein